MGIRELKIEMTKIICYWRALVIPKNEEYSVINRMSTFSVIMHKEGPGRSYTHSSQINVYTLGVHKVDLCRTNVVAIMKKCCVR